MFDNWGNAIYQDTDASFVWMKAVWLVEFRITRATLNTLKEKGIKRHATNAREIRIDPIERDAVFLAPIRRRPHAGQQQIRSARLYFGDYVIQMSANVSGLDAAQCIVRAQFEDDQIGFFGKCPFHTGEAARGGVPRYSLVDDPHRLPLRSQTRFELGREGCLQRKPEPSGETVAQDDYDSCAGSGSSFSQRWPRYDAQHRADCEGAVSEESRTPLCPGAPKLAFISHSLLRIPTCR